MSSYAKHLHSINAGHYKNTAACETEVMPVPDVVKIPLSQHIGKPCDPLVKKGDEVKVGQLIGDTDAFVSAPIHSSVSGTVTGIDKYRSANGGYDTRVVIETDKKQTPWEGIKKPELTDFQSFVKAVRDSGLAGMGGASFPAHVKFNPKNLDEVDTLIVNGAECEPFITSDHRTMLEATQDIIDGALTIMKYMGMKQGFIGIEDNKQDAIAKLNKMLSEQHVENLKTFPLQAKYPKGAERVLIYEVTGRRVDAGMLPADAGVVVSNVSSVAFLGQYFRDGMPLIKRRVTVDGNAVANPKNVMALFGTSVKDLVAFCGGYKKPPKKIIMGGPMMGRATISDEVSIIKNNNAILCFDAEQAYIPEETACINCGRCHAACPFNLAPMKFADAYKHKDVEALQELQIMQCMNCGSCSFVCPARRPLAFMNTLAKGLVKEAGKK
ncbi:MAG: electron transport complex subunit RsxC [Clostridiales bacterium]|jgi:electron transport complex protein RnfC|nr:electron transport complex subunit RsxC [Clostridiales bacterium]